MINFEELNQEQTVYVEVIAIEPWKEFTRSALAQYGTASKLKKANKVADIIWQQFE